MWTRTITADPNEIPSLRRAVTEHLHVAIGSAADLDTVALLLSELASNAINHATEPIVVLVTIGRTVRVVVTDGSSTLPTVLPPDPRRVGGNGMRLVDTLASRWGADREGAGKTVWFELPLTG